MDETILIIAAVFMFLAMGSCLAFAAYILKVARDVLVPGSSSKILPDSGEMEYSPMPDDPKEIESYLDKVGGNRFTQAVSFEMPEREKEVPAKPKVHLTEEQKREVEAEGMETDASEIAVM